MIKKVSALARSRVCALKTLFLCLSSAVLLILSYPKFNIWLFAWIAFIPLFSAINNKSKARAFWLSYFTGVIFWSGTIYWLVHVTLPGTIILVAYLSIYFGVFGLIFTALSHKLSKRYFCLSIASSWALLEYARSYLFTGFGWALLSYSQYRNLPIIQISDFLGAWGVSFAIMLFNVNIHAIFSQTPEPRKKIRQVIPIALFLFIVLSYGYLRIYFISKAKYPNALKVAVVQGNIPQELKWMPSASNYILQKYARITKEAVDKNVDLIIWPEAAAPGILGEDDSVFKEVFSLAKKSKTKLLVGSVVRDELRYFNSALLIDEKGKIEERYDKLHLVPFGEYIPLKQLLPFLEVVVPIGDITRGSEYKVFKLQIPNSSLKASFSVLICFEDLFPELSRKFINSGARLLVNITNDAWYKKTSAQKQHLQASVFRAVENHAFLIRSANTGVSCFIRPDGKIVSVVQDKLNKSIFVDGYSIEDIPLLANKPTFYTRYGDVSIIALCLYMLLCASFLFFKKVR